MITILSGVGLLLAALAGFSLFSLKMPKGQLAMSGMANAAVATFLVEAIHKYITGDLLGLSFFRTVGETSGSLGGVAAAIGKDFGIPVAFVCFGEGYKDIRPFDPETYLDEFLGIK